MITSAEIRIKAQRLYTRFLKDTALGMPFERIVIPGNKKPADDIGEFQNQISDLRSQSKECKGYGYSIAWRTIDKRNLGRQDIPEEISFDTEADYLRFLKKEKEVAHFRADINMILSEFPQLHDWVAAHPLKITEYAGHWPDILKVLRYFQQTPHPDLYIRELPIEVHTKFIERNKSILKDLLDIVIAEFARKDELQFERRFNLRYSQSMIRIRLLDASLANAHMAGFDDIAMPINRFRTLQIPLKRVYIVENLVNFLTFPRQPGAMVIWGKGYGVAELTDVEFLRQTPVYYWGDIDVQGFDILSQFRELYPHTQSLLMDRHVFDAYFENDPGTPAPHLRPTNLTETEQALFTHLQTHNLRLEQEKLPQSLLIATLATLPQE